MLGVEPQMIKSTEYDENDNDYTNQNGQYSLMKNQATNAQKVNSFYNYARKLAFENNDGFLLGGGMGDQGFLGPG